MEQILKAEFQKKEISNCTKFVLLIDRKTFFQGTREFPECRGHIT